ncbi:MAG TPA: adenylate/guanylate cyclase domain-containing protein [Bryobacteraceae bacterium]|nr:adenylate/guanylate cyclase domain-containing protein [Bryobacteraceae bacterium]
MRRRIRRWATLAAIAVAGVLCAHLTGEIRFIQQIHLKALDTHFAIRGEMPTSDIVIIAIDEKTLNTFPELQLFWHRYYAEAIRAAAEAGARVFGLDVAFGIPVTKWEPDNDSILAEAVSTAAPVMPVVCGYVPAMMAKQKDWPIPVNIVASALGLSAYANLTADSDDFVRRQELIEKRGDGDRPLARSFALHIAEKYLGTEAEFRGGVLTLAGHSIPTDVHGMLPINFAGPPGTFPRISLADFVAAAREGRKAQLRQWVNGKAVLLGPDNIEDRYATPFFTLFSGPRWTTAGVEIHASTLATLLQRNYLIPAPDVARIPAMLATAAAAVAIVVFLSPAAAAASLAVIVAIAAIGTHILFRYGVLLSTSELLLVTLLCILGGLVYRFSTAEERTALFRSAVSLFVGDRVAKALADDQQIGLTAKREMLTILFTDLRGFTAFCDGKDAAAIVEFLNQYFKQMAAIIVKHGGSVNKYLGDGILAVFSEADANTSGNHAQRAVRCAVEIVSIHGELQTGAGIHSGPAVVGCIGSQDKMEHTALGDTVNIASRLEGLNKEHKTTLLMSQATRDLLNGEIATVCLGSVPVRGKTATFSIYTAGAVMPHASAAAGAESS